MENRDEAKFCRGCGSPLPRKKTAPVDAAKVAAVRKFWIRFFIIAGAAGLIGGIILGRLSRATKLEVIKQYTSKYKTADDMAFGTVKPVAFYLEGLNWNVTVADIKNVYPYAVDGKDPDFEGGMTVQQGEYKTPIPHADFMSLGIYNGRLYAVKFEFGALERYEAQQLKVPNKDQIMYGRFRGIYNIFKKLYGEPAFEKNEAKKFEVLEAISLVKSGKMKTGAPSNVYIYWDVGDTRAELVFFGTGRKLHLTVRFLYMPVWKAVGKY